MPSEAMRMPPANPRSDASTWREIGMYRPMVAPSMTADVVNRPTPATVSSVHRSVIAGTLGMRAWVSQGQMSGTRLWIAAAEQPIPAAVAEQAAKGDQQVRHGGDLVARPRPASGDRLFDDPRDVVRDAREARQRSRRRHGRGRPDDGVLQRGV